MDHMVQELDFIKPTYARVLHLFLSNPMQEHHEREVMRASGVSKGSSNRILRGLAEADFLTKERKGRMMFYRLNLKEPMVRQFKVLINIYALKELVDALKNHARRIVLFGSCSQGTDVKESDYDLFILTSEKGYVRSKVSDFNRKSGRKVAPIMVDANGFASLKRADRPLYENIQRGIMLWETE